MGRSSVYAGQRSGGRSVVFGGTLSTMACSTAFMLALQPFCIAVVSALVSPEHLKAAPSEVVSGPCSPLPIFAATVG